MISGMSDMNRREFGMAMAALAAMAGVAEGQESKGAGPVLAEPKVYRFDELPLKHNGEVSESRAVVQGILPTGEALEVHETMLMPGKMPHPPHHHSHSELLLIREGQVEYLTAEKTRPVGPGDIIFTASMVEHGLKNVGTVPAKYFVVAVGVQQTERWVAKPGCT